MIGTKFTFLGKDLIVIRETILLYDDSPVLICPYKTDYGEIKEIDVGLELYNKIKNEDSNRKGKGKKNDKST